MKIFVNGDEIELEHSDAEVIEGDGRLYVRTPDGMFSALAQRIGDEIWVSYKGNQYRVETKAKRTRNAGLASSGELRAPMPGQIVDVRFKEGDLVHKGDTIFVLEAMKTQQPFQAPFDGRITKLVATKGDQVADGDVLAVVESIEVPHE